MASDTESEGAMNVNTSFMRTALFFAIALLAVSVTMPATGAQAPAGNAPAPTAAQPLGPVTGNAANGKTLFVAHTCYGCHGFNGETGRRLVGTGSRNLANEENFIGFLRLRADQAPLLPSTGMPNYPENALNDAQAKDIYAYIRSVKPSSPELKDIPTLQQIIKAASRPYKP